MPGTALMLTDDEDLDMPMDAIERLGTELAKQLDQIKSEQARHLDLVKNEIQQAVTFRDEPLRGTIEEVRLQMGGLASTLNHTTSDLKRTNEDLKETREILNGRGGKSMDTRITVLEDNVEGNRERIETLEAKDHVLSVRQELEAFKGEVKEEIKEMKKREHGKMWWLITALLGMIGSGALAWAGHVWNAVEKH